MSNIAIRAQNISKRFRLGTREEMPDSFVAAGLQWAKAPIKNFKRLRDLSRFSEVDTPDVLWALRDVSFEIKQGEVIGFIGKNGAGKSTLLKILSRITDPTRGQVEVFGRVSSLLEVGTGFHPELTGRENVYLNGTILGMKKREIDEKFDEIVEFSGTRRFIETPVKRYSSGMMVRLAFAVAAHLEPEILIVDEVLSVGDAQFQQKSIGKMQDVARDSNRTVLFVSHNMGCIEKLCERVIVMDGGRITTITDTKTAIREYLKNCATVASGANIRDLPREGEGEIQLVGFRLLNEFGEEIGGGLSGCDLTFALPYEMHASQLSGKVCVGISVKALSGESLFTVYTHHTGDDFAEVGQSGEFQCRVRRLPLNAGRYLIHASVDVNGNTSDAPTVPVGYLEVEPGDFYGTGKLTTDRGYAPFIVDAEWKCTDRPAKQGKQIPAPSRKRGGFSHVQ
jgi:lipopolysaccharide transport system ATP-binding protein